MTKRTKSTFKPKSKAMIAEALDIVKNSEDDKSAVAFLRDTLVDDYPDYDFANMDLHEASKVLEKPEKKKSVGKKAIEDLNESVTRLVEAQERLVAKNKSKATTKTKAKTKAKTKRKSKTKTSK